MVAAFLAKARKKAMPEWTECRCCAIAHRILAIAAAESQRKRLASGFHALTGARDFISHERPAGAIAVALGRGSRCSKPAELAEV
jgi:hypothetical protein